MAIIEKSIIKTEAYFSEDKKHRYLLKKEWDKNKKKAVVIMINPSTAQEIVTDHTTMFVINNLSKLDYGSVDIVNMFSKVGTKLKLGVEMKELVGDKTDEFISKSVEKADLVVIAWGKGADNNKRITERQEQLKQLLEPFKEKLHQISEIGFHPLCPQVRNNWNLVKFK